MLNIIFGVVHSFYVGGMRGALIYNNFPIKWIGILDNLDKSPCTLTTTLTRPRCDRLDFHLHKIITNKVYVCYLVTFPSRTRVFDWCEVWWVSKKKHHKDKWEDFELQLQIFINHSTMKTIGRTYIFSLGINKLALAINMITKSQEVQILVQLLMMFHHRIFPYTTQVALWSTD